MMKHRAVVLCCSIAVSLLAVCSSVDVAGGSSSTDNGKVIGVICRENGAPSINTKVTLRPANFDPYRDTSAPVIDTTDSIGGYQFDMLASGVYTIEALSMGTGARALISAIMVDTATTHASTASLSMPGALKVMVTGCTTTNCYVYVPGTSLYAAVNNGVAFIDSVPSGFVPSLYYADKTNPATMRSIASGLSVSEGTTRVIADYYSWTHSARVVLATTTKGAGVLENVYNFPVLLRLSDANFDFQQAQPDGRDVRFKKADDTPLPFEIERWDAAGMNAEIWVRTDTIYGNDSTQYFRMFWGNDGVESASNSSEVFDTTEGFQGVWHLSGTGNSSAFDATENHYDGTSYVTSSVPGAIGTARDFNGTSSYITMPSTADSKLNFPQSSTYSISLWVYADTIDSTYHAIAGKGHEQYYLQYKCLKNSKATWEFVEFQDQKGWEYTQDSTPPAPGAKQWLHLTGVRSGTKQMLYINGELVLDTVAVMSGLYDRVTSDNFTIGSFGRTVTIPYAQGWSYFNGKIDEVRVSNVAPTSGWVRLSYMNQKTDDALVRFDNKQ